MCLPACQNDDRNRDRVYAGNSGKAVKIYILKVCPRLSLQPWVARCTCDPPHQGSQAHRAIHSWRLIDNLDPPMPCFFQCNILLHLQN